MSGSLRIVGTGIRPITQTTPDAVACIKRAHCVFFIAADPLTRFWLEQLNQNVNTLHDLYDVGKDRMQTYHQMADRILESVRNGNDVCVVAYGHPGVFAYPMHEAITRAREEGYDASMLAGVSAEDCLFADLGIDPGRDGCQTFEATDFLIRRRIFDPRSALVLWQIGVIGERSFKHGDGVWNPEALRILVQKLLEHYEPEHPVVIYEAACYDICTPYIGRTSLANLPTARVTPVSTLYVPPLREATVDTTMLARLSPSIAQ